jgi:hypothetical protein
METRHVGFAFFTLLFCILILKFEPLQTTSSLTLLQSSMAPQLLQNILDRIQSGTDWTLRTFLAVLLRCLGVLLKGVFRPQEKATRVDEHGQRRETKGEIIQKRMNAAGQKKHA